MRHGDSDNGGKLAQQLAYIEQVPLYGIFFDLRKAYDAIDMGQCLEIL